MIQQQDLSIFKPKIIPHPMVQTYRLPRWEERSLLPRRPARSSISQLSFRQKEVVCNASETEHDGGLITPGKGTDFERKDARLLSLLRDTKSWRLI